MASCIDRPQIVIICDTAPYPTRSGDNQRIAELIGVLREQGWYVHLLLCGFVDAQIRKICRSHVDALHVYGGAGWKTRIRNAARRVVRFADRTTAIVGMPPVEEMAKRMLGRSVTPLILDYWQRYPAGLDDYVARLSTSCQWKTVIVEYIWLHPAVDKLANGAVRLLDTHDLQHKRVEEFASRGMTFPLQISREEESRIFNKFDAIIAIQADEAAAIREMCPQLTVLTAGSSGSDRAHALPQPENGRILYVGGYNGANIDGLRRFLSSVWPEIRARHPDAKLRVCGYIYRAFLGEQFENVTFLGHKDSVEDEYAAASVVINPAWIGTGLKIKSIEALARGKVLVTTSKGIEGLPSNVRTSALVNDDDQQFAAELGRLLTDHEARQSLAQSAAAFASKHLNRRTVYRELFEFLEQHK
jgi:glycosyltransferase involved in cell wall biosynthesis